VHLTWDRADVASLADQRPAPVGISGPLSSYARERPGKGQGKDVGWQPVPVGPCQHRCIEGGRSGVRQPPGGPQAGLSCHHPSAPPRRRGRTASPHERATTGARAHSPWARWTGAPTLLALARRTCAPGLGWNHWLGLKMAKRAVRTALLPTRTSKARLCLRPFQLGPSARQQARRRDRPGGCQPCLRRSPYGTGHLSAPVPGTAAARRALPVPANSRTMPAGTSGTLVAPRGAPTTISRSSGGGSCNNRDLGADSSGWPDAGLVALSSGQHSYAPTAEIPAVMALLSTCAQTGGICLKDACANYVI
jgi:hypothetical protein